MKSDYSDTNINIFGIHSPADSVLHCDWLSHEAVLRIPEIKLCMTSCKQV